MEEIHEPLKTCVTAIVHGRVRIPSFNDEGETIIDEAETRADKAAAVNHEKKLPPIIRKPEFLEKRALAGNERGTLMHKVLSLFDLKTLKDAEDTKAEVERQLQNMVDDQIIKAEEQYEIDTASLASFYMSGLGQRLLRSTEIHREWQFNMPWRGKTLLQGIIDLCFRGNDGQWILVDYKNDRPQRDEELLESYGKQLIMYAEALEKITGDTVGEIWLFALRMGRGIRVQRPEDGTGLI